VIALFGLLNAWNDTIATALKTQPARFAAAELASLGWDAGRYAR
jgi:hypothetical protein